MSSTISERLHHLINTLTTASRRHKQLEEETGIPKDRWTAFAAGRQRPTAEMIEAIGRRYPDLCLWLITGDADPANSQYDPETHIARKKYDWRTLIKKEPRDLTEEEMKVLMSEAPKLRHDSPLEVLGLEMHHITLIIAAWNRKKTREQILREGLFPDEK